MPARIGFIGVGGNAREHLKNLSQIPDAQIAAICDVVEDVAREVGGQYACPYYSDYRPMLDAERLDAVYVCTPPFARGAPEMAMADQRIEVAQLPQRDVDHKNILSQQSLKSISSDRRGCVDCRLPDQGGNQRTTTGD